MGTSLKQKLIWRFSIFTTLAMSAITIIVAFMISSALNNQLQKSLKQEANDSLKRIEHRLSFLAEQTKIFSKNHFLINSLIDVEGRKIYLPELTNNFNQFEDVNAITVVDFNGKTIFGSKNPQKSQSIRSQLRKVLETGNSLMTFDKTSLNIIMAEPIIYYDTPQGAVIAEFKLLDIMKRASIKSAGIYHKFFIQNQLIQSHAYDKSSSYISVSVKGNDSSPLLEKILFKLELGKLSSVFFFPVKESIIRLTLISILVIFLAIILSARIGATFSQPILELCRKVSMGNECSPTGTNDELETLATIFDKQRLAVSKAKEELETRVELRTKELTESNNQLKYEVITRKQTEEQLKVAKDEADKANQAKTLFLANMSHEIRTPMNAVLGYSQIMLRNKKLDEETKEGIKTIDSSGRNLLKMINEILDISKIEAGKMELSLSDFDIKSLIDDLSSLFEIRCRQKQLRWTVIGFSNPARVHGDETKLRQILVNLLGNAIKFTESGEVSFKVTSMDNNNYHFSITDTGIGIPEEAQKKIFEAFHQNEEGSTKGGTGLGLAIAKKQLELMKSDLTLISNAYEGSQFSFILHLPASTNVLESSKLNVNSILHLAPECRVKALVVDDVKENRDVLSKLLQGIGAETLEARDGKEGVKMAKELLPDIIFMDMRMPVMRGEDALKLIHEALGKQKIRIVAITASALGQRREHYLSFGFDEYISKPFREEEVFNCLKKLLNVEFIYEDVENNYEGSRSTEIDLSQFSIPENLHSKLKNAAELYSISELERALDELNHNGEPSGLLIEHIKGLLKNYDMEAILKILEKTPIIKN